MVNLHISNTNKFKHLDNNFVEKCPRKVTLLNDNQNKFNRNGIKQHSIKKVFFNRMLSSSFFSEF